MVPLRDGCNWRETPDWVVAWICGEANFWQNVLQNYFHDQTSSIGARTSTSAQRRSKNIVQLDSIIARSRRSKEFCNTIPSESRRSSPILLSRGSANNGHSSYCSCTDRQLVEVLSTRPRRGGWFFFCSAVCRRRCAFSASKAGGLRPTSLQYGKSARACRLRWCEHRST